MKARRPFPWLEALLGVALVALVLLLFPTWGQAVLWAANPKNWPRTVWFAGNLLIVFLLLAVRFGPQLVEEWRTRRDRLTAERAQQARDRELREEREALERMKESRRRRIY